MAEDETAKTIVSAATTTNVDVTLWETVRFTALRQGESVKLDVTIGVDDVENGWIEIDDERYVGRIDDLDSWLKIVLKDMVAMSATALVMTV